MATGGIESEFNTSQNNNQTDESESAIYQPDLSSLVTQLKSPKLGQEREFFPRVLSKPFPGSYNSSTLPASTSKLSFSKYRCNNKSALLVGPSKPMRLRIVLVGSEMTGKSCLIKRYCEKRFVSKYMPTIGIDYGATKIFVDKCEVSVHIFDTSGSDLFTHVRNEFYCDAHGILLTFDVTKRDTFECLTRWLNEVRSELVRRCPQRIDAPVILVCGNKVDLLEDHKNRKPPNCVDEIEAKLWADVHGLPYCETSASNGVGVGEMFHTFFSAIVKNQLDIITSGGGKLPKTPASARRVHIGGSSNSTSSSTAPSSSPSSTKYSTPASCTKINDGVEPTKEQEEVMKRLRGGKDAWEQLGVSRECTKDDINKIYRKLAILLHPDKTAVKGADDAFKLLCFARKSILMTF